MDVVVWIGVIAISASPFAWLAYERRRMAKLSAAWTAWAGARGFEVAPTQHWLRPAVEVRGTVEGLGFVITTEERGENGPYSCVTWSVPSEHPGASIFIAKRELFGLSVGRHYPTGDASFDALLWSSVMENDVLLVLPDRLRGSLVRLAKSRGAVQLKIRPRRGIYGEVVPTPPGHPSRHCLEWAGLELDTVALDCALDVAARVAHWD